MRRVRARERLADPDYGGRLTMGGVMDLMLEAGYSEEAAQRAASRRGWDRLCAGVPM